MILAILSVATACTVAGESQAFAMTTWGPARDSTTSVDSLPPQPAVPPVRKNVFFLLKPSLGINASTISNTTGDHATFDWNTLIQSTLTIDGSSSQFFSSFLLQFAEHASDNTLPSPIQDILMLTVRPSWQITNAFKLFLETTVQTQVAPGLIDGEPTNALDPIFIYESACVGQSNQSNSSDGALHLDWTYGVGYAFQETFTRRFVLTPTRSFRFDPNDPNNLLRPVQSKLNFDRGFIGILSLNFNDRLAPDLFFNASMNGYAVGKEDLFTSITNSRAAGSLMFGLQYKSFAINYNGQILYDKNYSYRRQLQQYLALTFSYQIQL